jgi:hypothetical protein
MPAEPTWTPEDVELVAEAMHRRECNCGASDVVSRNWAEDVLAALAEAGRLREPGGEPDLWQYAIPCAGGPEEPIGPVPIEGKPRYISPRWVRRPLYAGGSWQPVDTPKDGQYAAE